MEGRAGQGRAGQGRTELSSQGRAGQGRAGPSIEPSIETQLSTAHPSRTEAGLKGRARQAEQVILSTATSPVAHMIASSCSM